ncbi:MAG TPA: heparinase II/III family protein, partial [Candidatus Synoicihabitans sp.]|nr:heparinase II/III family protein [Candidatus Synoicihabitans sp.]
MNAFGTLTLDRRDFLKATLGIATLTAGASRSAAVARIEAAGVQPMFFDPSRIAALRERVTKDGVVREKWTRLIARADELSATRIVSFAEANAGPGYRAGFPVATQQLTEMAFVLGLAWRVTGDERYARTLHAAVRNSLEFPHWTTPGMAERRPRWRSDLWTGAFTVAVASGREALGDFLAADERRSIGAGLRRLGVEPLLGDWVLPEQRIHALDSMGHNWWCVCVSAAGIGALALREEEPRAVAWLDQVESALDGFFDYRGQVLHNKPANFDGAGSFYESVQYADYTLFQYLRFRLARLQALPAVPPRPMPMLDRVADFFAHACYPTSTGDLSVDIGDSRLEANGARTIRLLAMIGISSEVARWYSGRRGDPLFDPLSLLFSPPAGPGQNNLPRAAVFPAAGWASFRDAWTENATLLAMRCGVTWNHAHPDAGSFVLYHAGRPLIIDSGMCSYDRCEYTDY